jgi:hypothetical protein
MFRANATLMGYTLCMSWIRIQWRQDCGEEKLHLTLWIEQNLQDHTKERQLQTAAIGAYLSYFC